MNFCTPRKKIFRFEKNWSNKFFFLNKTGNIASFYLKKKKRIDQFISGEPTENRTNAPISSWSTTTFGITTARPGHMPTVGHTRQRQTAPTLTTNSAREICRTCTDRVSTGHRLPVIVAAGILHRSSDSTATRRSTREPIRHAGMTDYRSPHCDPNFACHIIVAKLHAAPPASNLSNVPSIFGPQAEVGSEMMPPRRRKTQTAPPSPDPKDLRFPSIANRGR
jgi:hypothetical protein